MSFNGSSEASGNDTRKCKSCEYYFLGNCMRHETNIVTRHAEAKACVFFEDIKLR